MVDGAKCWVKQWWKTIFHVGQVSPVKVTDSPCSRGVGGDAATQCGVYTPHAR